MVDPASRPGQSPAQGAAQPDRAPDRLPAGAADPDLPSDRVFLSGYTTQIEIGAYAEERDVMQRLRFNIVLDVTRNTAHVDDQVGRVVNYDTMIEAIEALAAGPRINLLETFAERLAQVLLEDPRARRILIRIEKLDRLPHGATLGCEIARARSPEANERIWALASEIKPAP